MVASDQRSSVGTKPSWDSGRCKSLLLGTRPEEQDVGPKATDIMSGVFEVFVNLTQVFAGDP